MTSDRVYQPPIATSDALAELRRCAGSHFDPRVVAEFCARIESGQLPASRMDAPGPPIDIEPLPTALRDPLAEPDSYV
jgi:HD-GYP domain-containing protein (c-di-GMP phosphodiesterase class II)